ncbi:transposase [Escherichia coli]|nr:transposase [Escherichia coli]
MEKFSLEFKKVVSEKYLEGEVSLKSVARMYGISPCTVRKWAYAYWEHGISILTGKKAERETVKINNINALKYF